VAVGSTRTVSRSGPRKDALALRPIAHRDAPSATALTRAHVAAELTNRSNADARCRALVTPRARVARDGQERAHPRRERVSPRSLGSSKRSLQETARMFIAYEISRQLIVSLRPLVPVILASDRDLADQF